MFTTNKEGAYQGIKIMFKQNIKSFRPGNSVSSEHTNIKHTEKRNIKSCKGKKKQVTYKKQILMQYLKTSQSRV